MACCRSLTEHFGLLPPQKERSVGPPQLGGDRGAHVTLAQGRVFVLADQDGTLKLVPERLPVPQEVLVHEIHQGVKLLQVVLDGRAADDQAVGAR